MEATPTLVINYFSTFKQNLVPLFQRPYTWSIKQWRTLWEDIVNLCESDEGNYKASHFMGAVVTMPARSVPAGVSKFLIIDGQQRLLTVSLLMCAVRDALREDEVNPKRRIQIYLTNEGFEGNEFFKLLPTEGDRAAYSSIVREEASQVTDAQCKRAYDYFRRLLARTDSNVNVDATRVLEIIEKRLMVVMINLSDTDDPYLIFESLNFKGAPLEQADLVRNYFLMKFAVGEQKEIYDRMWLPMQERLGSHLNEFMHHFLGAEGVEVRRGDVYAKIRKLDSDAASVRILMSRMEHLSRLYCRISKPKAESHPELRRYFDHFITLDLGSVYPFLLSCYEDFTAGRIDLEEFLRVLRVLHSFILRRVVVGVPSNSLAGFFVLLSRSKRSRNMQDQVSGLSAWLSEELACGDKSRRWPTDVEFKEGWMHTQIYHSRACQIILECIEEYYDHHEMPAFERSSIEHVMPQSLTRDWSEMLGADATYVHGQWLHTIGNLTLTGYNSELGNRPYGEKREKFASSHFEVNRYFRAHAGWGSTEIQERAQALFEIATQLWPRPAANIPVRNAREFGPITYRGTPRKRSWGALRPAVEDAIPHLDRITSRTVYDYLEAKQFKFATPRALSSISSILRELNGKGVLTSVGRAGAGDGTSPIAYERAARVDVDGEVQYLGQEVN